MAGDQTLGDVDDAAAGSGRGHAATGPRAPQGMLEAFDVSPVPTAITRAVDGVILFANRACLELLGWGEQEFVGRTMVEVGFWARPDGRAAMLELLARDGAVRDLEQEISTKDGEARIVLTSISRLDLDGEPCLIGHIHDITERRRLELRLREGEQRFRQVTETFQQGFVLADLDPPRVLYASPAVERVFGVDLDVLYRDPTAIQRLMHPDDRAAVLAARNGLLAATDFEFRIVRPDGETRWIRTRAEPVEPAAGAVARVAAVSEDITTERALRDALRAGEERWRLMVEGVQDYAILMLDVDGLIATWNSGAKRIKGYEANEVVGRHFSIFYEPEDVAAGKPQRELEVARAEGRMEDEGWRVRKDGTRFWANVIVTALRDADGTLRGYGKVTRDLTERRASDLELKASEERFRLLAENSTDVIGRVAPDQRLLYVSPACRTVYRYEPEAMVGRFAHEFIHPDDLASISADFSPDTDEQGVTTNTCRVLRGDGTYTWVEAKIRALRDPVTGEIIEFHTVARDVSERMQAESDVRRAKEEAEHANAAKSDFLSRMSHELRTPLHAILGFGQLLEAGELQPDQREQLRHITSAGHHLLELINEVLDLSRIEDGELRISLEPVRVSEVVDEALQMLEPLAAARSITLGAQRIRVGDDLHVQADRQRLKQVLLNLLSNAVKYNHEGGEVRVATTLADRDVARLEVADTGIGIASEDLARAFEAFERLGAETTEVEGTGLGLALTKRLVETMGGTIGVESEIGHGTTFSLELPVVAAPRVRGAAPARAEAPAATRRTDPRTVLYVEDNPSNIKLVETILRERPEVTLLVAQQGSLGLELARVHLPALVLLDLNLPDCSGADILRRLRSDPRTADIAVVVVSADATPSQVARLRRAGAAGYLTKPFDIGEFLAIVDGAPEHGAAGDDAPGGGAATTSSPGAAPDGPLDHSLLDRLRNRNPDGRAVNELIDLFLDDSPARLAALDAAAAAEDAEAVRETAHGWRGACSFTGAHRLVALLGDIEVLARVGTTPDRAQLAAMRRAFDEARDALVELRSA